jgi:hypothetical protein
MSGIEVLVVLVGTRSPEACQINFFKKKMKVVYEIIFGTYLFLAHESNEG